MNKPRILRTASRALMPAAQNSMSECYKLFRSDPNVHFKTVYDLKVISKPDILLVLDSSFNPPHLGHLTLIQKALTLYHEKSAQVLLLLAVNNADKKPAPASFDKRLEMMCLLADLLNERDIPVSVGITEHGKFVDKDSALKDHYKDAGTISFLLGFDTIRRIFDPKYYHPKLPSEALEEFMSSTELCCLTREDDYTLEEQIKYSSDISNGSFEPDIPRSWGSKIHMMENDKRFEGVSSSSIRREIAEGTSSEYLKKFLPASIVDYLLSSKRQVY